jgi:membrane-bound lytic murein transglycosylase B
MKPLRFILAAALAITGATVAASPEEREQAVSAFVNDMAEKHGFEHKALMRIMNKARFRRDIIRVMQRPAEAKPWHQYRPIFVTQARTRGGVQFWRDHEALLEHAEKEFGVAPEMIVAIIGVETRYGGNTGKYRVLDSLSTLAFGYPKRANFFRKELEEFLLLSREEDIDIAETKGSYAGAMGMPQFIPSSYRAYAVDFDGDGKRDLLNSTADVIGSIANYFKMHGWKSGDTVTLKARTGTSKLDALVDAGMKPSLSPQQLSEHGVEAEGEPLPKNALASLIRLENKSEDEYWLGLHNFYVITRYNHSNLYAMAVYQLSQEILELRSATQDELVGG